MGGLLGKSPDAPEFVELDERTKGLVDRQASSAASDELVNQSNQAYDMGSGLAQNPQSNAQSAASGSDQAFTQALHNQYYGKAKRDIDNLKSQGGLQAQADKGQALSNAAKIAIGQQQARMQQYQFLTNAYNQQEQAKASAVNQLFQLGAYGMGQYFGNKTANPASSNGVGDYSKLIPDGGRNNDYSTLR